ncbi:MAG: radical SAM protein [Desulfobacteraceae bacterium]|nr:MAG: radical SAM protein [Desulfobacteraceae bacterium]
MNCGQDAVANGREFFERFYPKILKNRIPVVGGIELTTRCNLNCSHCYVSDSERKGRPDQKELTTRQWMDLIDQVTGAGCLFLLFTGGEVLLRPDFCDIYRHACRNGLLVTVFTNGTLVTDRILEIFDAYPPYSIEISLYGATAATYEAVTGVAGSFEKCIQGIHRLKAHGFRLKLKTVVLTINFDELEHIESLAAEIGAPFRFDAMISARLDGDPAPLKYRVNPKDAVRKEFSSRDRAKALHDFFCRMNHQPVSTDLYQCGAGRNMFHISPSGWVRPCLMVSGTSRNLLTEGFSKIWGSNDFKQFRDRGKAPVKCRECDKKAVCGYCPGFFQLESGQVEMSSEYLCDIGRERKQAILNFHLEENKACQ